MRKGLVTPGLVVLGIATAALVAVRAAGPSSTPAERTRVAEAGSRRQFLDTYCVTCHNEKRKASFANLALDTIDVEQLAGHAATWETLIKKLRVGAMPPAG